MAAADTNSIETEAGGGFSVTQAVKSATRSILANVPLSIWSQLFPKDVIGLCYHIVSDVALPHARFSPFKNSRQFRSDIQFLMQNYGLLGYQELVERRFGLESGKRDNKFMITFDDGFVECFDVVRPILHEFDVPAAFFITTDFTNNRGLFFEGKLSLCVSAIETADGEQLNAISKELKLLSFLDRRLSDNRQSIADCRRKNVVTSATGDFLRTSMIDAVCQLFEDDSDVVDRLCERLSVDCSEYLSNASPFMTTDQIQEMSDEGFTIGAHTRSHCDMNGMSDAEIEDEIVESCGIVHQITGREVPFAFPYNGGGIARELLADIRQRHDFVGLYFDNTEMVRDELHIVSRIGTDAPDERLPEGTNLPGLLRRIWSRQSSWN